MSERGFYAEASGRLMRSVVSSRLAYDANRDAADQAAQAFNKRLARSDAAREDSRQWASQQLHAVSVLIKKGDDLTSSLGLAPGGGGVSAPRPPRVGLEETRWKAEAEVERLSAALAAHEEYSLRQQQIRFVLSVVLLITVAVVVLLINRQVQASRIEATATAKTLSVAATTTAISIETQDAGATLEAELITRNASDEQEAKNEAAIATALIQRYDNATPTSASAESARSAILLTPLHLAVSAESPDIRPVLVSQSSGGEQGNGDSDEPTISADGRYVAFTSKASNLVNDDRNQVSDVFVRDLQTNETILISRNSSGIQGNGRSANPSISADGRFIAFWSIASNLVNDDNNGMPDIFLHDQVSGETILISRGLDGEAGDKASYQPSITSDGQCIVFTSDSRLTISDLNNVSDIYIYDKQVDTVNSLSFISRGSDGQVGNGRSLTPSTTADCQLIAFQSAASNLGGNTPGYNDIFLRARQANETSCINCVANTRLAGSSFSPVISATGLYLTFVSSTPLVIEDNDHIPDIYLKDIASGEYFLVSRHTVGTKANMESGEPVISPDGRFVAFMSEADNLSSNQDTNRDADIFLFDSSTSITFRVSRGLDGMQTNASSSRPAISEFGRYIAFATHTTSPEDTNGAQDIYLLSLEGQ